MADLSEYRALDGIEFSPEVRKLMILFAECWEECHADDCTTCKYRHGRNHYKLMYCLSERYAEKLIANDVATVVHGHWEPGNPICPVCGENKFKDLDADIWCDWQPDFCPNCGAKMDGGADG